MRWLEPPKGFSLRRHIEKVEAIERIVMEYVGSPMTPPVYNDLLDKVCARLHYPVRANVDIRLMFILPADEGVFDRTAARCLSLFLLEHNNAFKHGKLTELWDGSQHLWMCVRITSVRKHFSDRKGIPMRYRTGLLALNGPMAGYITPVLLSTKYSNYLPKLLGCPKREHVKAEEARGMHTFAKMGTAKGKPMTLIEVQPSTTMKTENRNLYRSRQ